MTDQKNTIIAIVLSAIVLIAWQVFFGLPAMQKQKQQTQQPAPAQTPAQTPAPATPAQAPAQAGTGMTREAALATSPRLAITTPSISGSVALKGGRLDDVLLVKYRETVDPHSPPIVLLSPSGSPAAFYSEFGWSPGAGSNTKVPGPDTVWRQDGTGALSVDHPVTLVYDNGEGLEFRRTITVDDKY